MPRVLLITSESFMLNLLKEKFEQEDFEVITAETIAEGLVEAQRSIPDLIVLEERLQREETTTLKDQLRSIESLQRVPVILLTVRDGVLSTDGDVALPLPFRPKHLIALALESL